MSIKIDQAFVKAMLDAGLQIDIVQDGGVYSFWDGANYSHRTGTYSPQATREYVEIRNFPASRGAFTVSDSDEAVGVYQAIVRYPGGTGPWDCKRKADEIISEVLAVGRVLSYAGQDVLITSVSRDGGREEGGYYQVVVRGNYRAFLSRG